jgi:sulfatase maturation enzyme AslB (radical SAM superfamily)
MANIMITEACNLSCPYCFADEFVNRKASEISVDNFRMALEFVCSSKSFNGLIGIIGGEPTLHHKFSELLKIVNGIERIKEVVIFTNGIKLDETMQLTSSQKFSFLINLNSPEITGKKNYSRIIRNIDELVSKYDKKHSVTLGLNLHKIDMQYDFFLDILYKYRFRSARLSITVPNSAGGGVGLTRLTEFKDLIYKLYIDLRYRDINVIFDCNKVPICLWTEEEVKKISLIQANNDNERLGFDLNSNKCNPVIDILPDLTAVRCFGLSQISKVNISDFASLGELRSYYRTNIDEQLLMVPTVDACRNCDMFNDYSCYGGCLANKLRLTEVNQTKATLH